MDLELKETGNGGDLVKKTNDFNVIEGFQNMPYLGLFGGNPRFPTPTTRPENEQAFDWWGNNLFLRDLSKVQFNSLTEQELMNVALNSSGAASIEQAAKKDLEFMEEFANVDISVTIINDDKLALGIVLRRPPNEQNKAFIYIWDATIQELSELLDEGGNIIELFILTPEGNFILTPEGNKLLFL